MNMTFSGGENATPVLDEDDPDRRKITLFSKQALASDQIHYGYHMGHVEIEFPIRTVQTFCCDTVFHILSKSNNPRLMIKKLLSYDKNDEHTT